MTTPQHYYALVVKLIIREGDKRILQDTIFVIFVSESRFAKICVCENFVSAHEKSIHVLCAQNKWTVPQCYHHHEKVPCQLSSLQL